MHSSEKKTTSEKMTSNGVDAPADGQSSRVDVRSIKPGMPVVCSEDGQFAVIDHMEGRDTIKLNKDASGVHHYIPIAWVTRVDDKVHVDRPGSQAMREWSSRPPMAS